MRTGLVRDTNRVALWVAERMDLVWVPGMGQAMGYEVEGELVCGVLYTDFNGAALQMHVAAIPGSQWLRREFLFNSFWYPFEQLNCRKVIGPVAASNTESRRFVENLGFVLEATLKDAHPDGAMLIYSMTPAQCRWLQRTPQDGKAQSTTAA